MRIGLLRHRVIIEQRATTQTAALDQSSAWSAVLTDWARIEPLSGRELIAGAAVQNEATHRVTMRYRSVVTAGMRVKYGSRYFNITSPPRNLEERGREMVFEAQEGLADG